MTPNKRKIFLFYFCIMGYLLMNYSNFSTNNLHELNRKKKFIVYDVVSFNFMFPFLLSRYNVSSSVIWDERTSNAPVRGNSAASNSKFFPRIRPKNGI